MQHPISVSKDTDTEYKPHPYFLPSYNYPTYLKQPAPTVTTILLSYIYIPKIDLLNNKLNINMYYTIKKTWLAPSLSEGGRLVALMLRKYITQVYTF